VRRDWSLFIIDPRPKKEEDEACSSSRCKFEIKYHHQNVKYLIDLDGVGVPSSFWYCRVLIDWLKVAFRCCHNLYYNVSRQGQWVTLTTQKCSLLTKYSKG